MGWLIAGLLSFRDDSRLWEKRNITEEIYVDKLYKIEFSIFGRYLKLQKGFEMTRMARKTWLGLLTVTVLAAAPVALMAQQTDAAMVKQTERQAMRKLSFLVGRWSGPVTVYRGAGQPLQLTQSENVQYKLSGLVMLIEGRSTDAEGRTMFRALAVISYDPASRSYRFRAYHGGQYLDTPLKVDGEGFGWGFTEGRAHIVNSMHLTKAGEWSEATQVTVGSHPAFRSMTMELRHKR